MRKIVTRIMTHSAPSNKGGSNKDSSPKQNLSTTFIFHHPSFHFYGNEIKNEKYNANVFQLETLNKHNIIFFSELKQIQLLQSSNTTVFSYSQAFKLRNNMTLVFVFFFYYRRTSGEEKCASNERLATTKKHKKTSMHLKQIHEHINILLQFSRLGTPLPYLPHDTIILVDMGM